MARFVFELETLLEQRRREERDRMKAVGEIERERVAIEDDAAALGRELRDEREALRGELARDGGVDLRRVQMQAGASLHGLRRTNELALQAASLLKRLEVARAALQSATTRRRAVELLRERRYRAWLDAQRSAEAREFDELMTARFPGTTEGASA